MPAITRLEPSEDGMWLSRLLGAYEEMPEGWVLFEEHPDPRARGEHLRMNQSLEEKRGVL
jgi:hypothetical protein